MRIEEINMTYFNVCKIFAGNMYNSDISLYDMFL